MRNLAGRVAGTAVMLSCCGLAMAIALGLVVLTGGWLVAGAAGLVVAGCVVAAVFAVRRRPRPDDSRTAAPSCEAEKAGA